jgi:hypothetical protein
MTFGGDNTISGSGFYTQIGDLMISSKHGNIDFQETTIAGSDNDMLAKADELLKMISQNAPSESGAPPAPKFDSLA